MKITRTYLDFIRVIKKVKGKNENFSLQEGCLVKDKVLKIKIKAIYRALISGMDFPVSSFSFPHSGRKTRRSIFPVIVIYFEKFGRI